MTDPPRPSCLSNPAIALQELLLSTVARTLSLKKIHSEEGPAQRSKLPRLWPSWFMSICCTPVILRCSGGRAELGVRMAVSAQMGQRHGIPCTDSAGMTNSKLPDFQAGCEKGNAELPSAPDVARARAGTNRAGPRQSHVGHIGRDSEPRVTISV